MINENEIKTIQETIKEVESKTSGEIVPALLRESDLYPASHFRWSLLMGFLFSSGLYYLGSEQIDPIYYLYSQLGGMIFGYLLAFIPGLKKLMIFKAEMDEEVAQKGYEIFFEKNLHHTKDRTGILILVSLLEHRIKILADSGINEKVPADFWEKQVEHLKSYFKKGNYSEGICEVIKECGKVLEDHFPQKEDDVNEIKDHLIIE